MRAAWNHNIHYHALMLRAVPETCGRALDVGCGHGLLTRKLTARCAQVVGLDPDPACLMRAGAGGNERLTYFRGDFLTHDFEGRQFSFITAVASLHHLPLAPALRRFAELMEPGGVLAITGLYRPETVADFACNCLALPVSRLLRCIYRFEETEAPMRAPRESLREIRRACASSLPGAVVRRRLLFRYSLFWRKPQGTKPALAASY